MPASVLSRGFLALRRVLLSGLLLTGVGVWLTGAVAQPPTGPGAPDAPVTTPTPVAPAAPNQAKIPAGSPDDLEFFEQRIRPLLVEQCYACHNSSQTAEGGLALDAREPLRRGGDSGPVLVPGQPDESLLLQVVRHEAGVSKMPKGGPRLTAAAVADLRRWIERGGVDPRDQPPSAQQLEQATAWPAVFERRKRWWSFQPLRRPELSPVTPVFAAGVENRVEPGQPAVDAAAEAGEREWTEEPAGDTHVIDRFLQARLAVEGLRPAPLADRATLVRRVTQALTGLPPTAEETREFVHAAEPDAWPRLVDRLLASPRFGERQARHFMDLVRYCESHGSQGDPELAQAWRYRDYLVRAFNADLPYDQLLREHIAGDLLPEPRWNAVEGFNESALATLQLRMVELGFVPVDALDDRVKVVDNQIDVLTKTFLGLTVSCARCHDHKFDPISQADFYALFGVFASGHPGPIEIDPPAVRDRHRERLAGLKGQIRAGLAQAWQQAAPQVVERWREREARSRERATLVQRRQAVQERIAAFERPALAEALRRRAASPDQPAAPAPEGATLPRPEARWSFEQDARDSVGEHHGELLDGARVERGRLLLDGRTASVRTRPVARDWTEKTFEVWVALANHEQRGGGVLGLDTPVGQFFDSIVFGELKPGYWMAGSDFFRRTNDPNGPAESAGPDTLVHVAIVYSADHRITLYRNGEPYGQGYQKGELHRFKRGEARFLFGQRLTGINPPLAGEVEEARAYGKALSASEIATSFAAGPQGVSLEELAAVFTPTERATWQELRGELDQVNRRVGELAESAELARLFSAAQDPAHFLHPWQLATDPRAGVVAGEQQAKPSTPANTPLPGVAVPAGDAAVPAAELAPRLEGLTQFWRREVPDRRELNLARHPLLWDLRGPQRQQWFQRGPGLESGPGGPGEFAIDPTADRFVGALWPAGAYSLAISPRHTGLLASPRFVIREPNLFVRGVGPGARVRLVIEDYPLGNGGIYPAVMLGGETTPGWSRLDTAYRLGSHAHLEVQPSGGERSWFGLIEVRVGASPELPRETTPAAPLLLEPSPPRSLAELEARYATVIATAARAWGEGVASDSQVAALDSLLRAGWLPTTLGELPEVAQLVAEYRRLEQELTVPRTIPGLYEGVPYDQPLFVRGQHTRPGDPVARRGLSLFGGPVYGPASSGRLEWAHELASPRNPLVARVAVNRLWQQLFGRGLVASVDNFGALGELPTHPELLDELATQFMAEGWSVKRMLRLMLTSRAWRQVSRPSAEAARLDPDNRWLSHMPVRRLEAEAVRDSLLAIAGELDARMGGPGVNVYFTNKTEGGGPPGPLDGDRRRSVYLKIRRNAHHSLLEVFDAPKPSTTRGRRDQTNVPAQALAMLNDPLVLDQAKKWGARVAARRGPVSLRVAEMFQAALGRAPTPAERTLLLEELRGLGLPEGAGPTGLNDAQAQTPSPAELEAWQDLAHSLFCLKEFLYVE